MSLFYWLLNLNDPGAIEGVTAWELVARSALSVPVLVLIAAAGLAAACLNFMPHVVLRRGRRLLLFALRLIGLALKRLQEWPRMAKTWSLLFEERPRDIEPRLELAKYHEHRARDLSAAERLCVETLELLETRAALGRALDLDTGYVQDFQHRLERIRRKMARPGRADDEAQGLGLNE